LVVECELAVRSRLAAVPIFGIFRVLPSGRTEVFLLSGDTCRKLNDELEIHLGEGEGASWMGSVAIHWFPLVVEIPKVKLLSLSCCESLFGCLDTLSSFSCWWLPIGEMVVSFGAAAALMSGLSSDVALLVHALPVSLSLELGLSSLELELFSLELVLLALQEDPRFRGGASP
jgi:hypothetical protein